VLGAGPGRAFPGQPAGVADAALRADGKDANVPGEGTDALAQTQRLAGEGSREPAGPEGGSLGIEGFEDGAAGQFGGRPAEDGSGVAEDALEDVPGAGDPLARGRLIEQTGTEVIAVRALLRPWP
jgi:hypothetical protein